MALRRSLMIPAAIILALAGICIYFYFDPSESALFPKCSFYCLTGLKCPGCGSQRAIHALLHGDLSTAVRFNAMMVVALPVVLLLCVGELVRTRRPELYLKLNSRWVIRAAFIVVTGWWIVRNLIGQ